ncbi:MAG: DUF3141 domain-containing protein [Burkholderiales bacterium]|nr:DUF3141 domain-containing protein [Burkholderiales bacterium]
MPISRSGSASSSEVDPGIWFHLLIRQPHEVLMNTQAKLARSHDIATKVSVVFKKRAEHARDEFVQRLEKAAADNGLSDVVSGTATGAPTWTDWMSYAVDATQRSILFWDTLRQRGNNFVAHTQAGLPPLLHFDYENVVDGRTLKRPVNYAGRFLRVRMRRVSC